MDTNDTPQSSEDMPPRSLWRSLSLFCLIAVLATIWLITATTPGRGGPFVILAFLFLVFTSCGLFAAVLIEVFSTRISGKSVSAPRLLYTSTALAAGIVLLVGLQTLRQLTFIDVVLVTLLELLLNFYLFRRF